MSTRPFACQPVQLVLGLIIWSIWFVVLYGGLSVACAAAPPAANAGAVTWINGVLLLLTLATAVLLGFYARRCWRASAFAGGDRSAQFIARVGAGVHLVSTLATLVVGLPVLVFPPCI